MLTSTRHHVSRLPDPKECDPGLVMLLRTGYSDKGRHLLSAVAGGELHSGL